VPTFILWRREQSGRVTRYSLAAWSRRLTPGGCAGVQKTAWRISPCTFRRGAAGDQTLRAEGPTGGALTRCASTGALVAVHA